MNIQEAIALADTQCPNGISETLKIHWLSELDGRVEREILSPDRISDFVGYAADVSKDTVLKIPYPYSSIYPTWLMMHIARMNGEMQKYNDGTVLCSETLEAYRRTLMRTEGSPVRKIRYF